MSHYIKNVVYDKAVIEMILNSQFFKFMCDKSNRSIQLLKSLPTLKGAIHFVEFGEFIDELAVFAQTNYLPQSITLSYTSVEFINILVHKALYELANR